MSVIITTIKIDSRIRDAGKVQAQNMGISLSDFFSISILGKIKNDNPSLFNKLCEDDDKLEGFHSIESIIDKLSSIVGFPLFLNRNITRAAQAMIDHKKTSVTEYFEDLILRDTEKNNPRVYKSLCLKVPAHSKLREKLTEISRIGEYPEDE